MFDLDVTKMEDLKKIIDKLFDIYKEKTTYQILKFDIAIYVPFWRASISYGFTNNYLPMFGFIGYFLFYFQEFGIVLKLDQKKFGVKILGIFGITFV